MRGLGVFIPGVIEKSGTLLPVTVLAIGNFPVQMADELGAIGLPDVSRSPKPILALKLSTLAVLSQRDLQDPPLRAIRP